MAAPHTTRLQLLLFALGALVLLAGCSSAGAEPAVTPPPAAAAVTAAPSPTPTQEADPVTETPEVEPADAAVAPAPVSEEHPEPVILSNPGFEEHGPDGLPTGWEHSGMVEAVLVEPRGRSGEFRLTHKAQQAYQVESFQHVNGLEDGWYTLRAWVRSSGGQNEAYIALRCGDAEQRTHIPPTTPGYRWISLTASLQVSGGECTIRLVSDGSPDTWASFDDIELVPGRAVLTVLGADISSLPKSEDFGGVYRYADGTEADALQILKDHGMNYARLRVWVDPPDGYHNKARILAMAARLKEQGIQLLVDFHYSDHWADPGKQIKPAAWRDYDFEQLKGAVYDHTYDVCSALVEQGTPPDMVQVGNEINAGMLWPDGSYENFDNLAALLKEGYRAVKDCSPTTPVMLHIAEGGSNDVARWWFDNITRRDVPFDVIGISYYPYWHGSLAELQANLIDISARYDKDVIVVETAYAFTDQDADNYPNIVSGDMVIPHYPLTPEGQRLMLRDVMAVVRAMPQGRGLGIFYWDAVWTAVEGNGWDATDPTSGNAWENQALFDFEGRALPALQEFMNP